MAQDRTKGAPQVGAQAETGARPAGTAQDRQTIKILGGVVSPSREKQSNQTLPKTEPPALAGAVCAQYVRCGRPGCKCARGELHGPYYYRFWRDRGRLRKKYIRPGAVEVVRAACEARRARRRESRDARVKVTSYFRALRMIERGDYDGAQRLLGVIHGR